MTILGAGFQAGVPLGVRRVWGPPDRCLMPPGECGRCMSTVLHHETSMIEDGANMCRCERCRYTRSVVAAGRRIRKAAEKGLTITPRPERRRPRTV